MAAGGAIMSTPLKTRVGQLVRLLSSEHIGEAGAAAHALNRTVATAGLDIHKLAAIFEAALPDAPALVPLDGDCCDWRSVAAFCHQHRDRLPARDADFVANLLTYRNQPTAKQLQWFADIHVRLLDGGRQ